MFKHVLAQMTLALLVCLALLGRLAQAAESPAEMLEKGIYNEETVGNLDEAIRIYRQVVAEAKPARTVAAQAQYRLGECLLKQGKKAEAAEAFKSLIESYPEQKELLAKAKARLPDGLKLLPAPWKDGERLTLELKLGKVSLGLIGVGVDADTVDGAEVWRMVIRRFVAGGQNQGVSHVVVDRGSNLPRSSSFAHTILGNSKAEWSADKLTVTMPAKEGKGETTTSVDLTGPAYSNDQLFFGFRQLPLAVGYKTTIPLRVEFTGGNAIDLEVSVPNKEKLETPAGTFDCFRLTTNIRQTFWVADVPERYLVKFEAEGATGLLTTISGSEPRRLESKELGLSVAVPKDWFAQVGASDNKSTSAAFYLVAPEMASVAVRARAKSRLDADERESPKAWAESKIKEGKDVYQDLKVVGDAKQESKFAGLPGVSFVVEYTSMDQAFTDLYRVAMNESTAVELNASAVKEQFEASREVFKTISDSVSLK